jgi:hypothetical protein
LQLDVPTRKARNTMGRKQRLAIKGALPDSIVLSTGGTVPATSSEPAAEPAAAPVTTSTNGVVASH